MLSNVYYTTYHILCHAYERSPKRYLIFFFYSICWRKFEFQFFTASARTKLNFQFFIALARANLKSPRFGLTFHFFMSSPFFGMQELKGNLLSALLKLQASVLIKKTTKTNSNLPETFETAYLNLLTILSPQNSHLYNWAGNS
jgi:hypothetical protein